MRKWEAAAIILALLAVVGTTVAAFAYQSYRTAGRAGDEGVGRSPTVLLPSGDPTPGRRVFLAKCASCHGQNAEGTPAGSNLWQAARRGDATFLYTWVLDPQAVTPRAVMPQIPLSEKEIADVVAYLLGLPQAPIPAVAAPPAPAAPPPLPAAAPPAPPSPTAIPAAPALPTPTVAPTPPAAPPPTPAPAAPPPEEVAKAVAAGQALYARKGCAACHGPNGQGTALAPPVVGQTEAQVKLAVRQPKNKMLPFSPAQLSDEELNAIAQYIARLGK